MDLKGRRIALLVEDQYQEMEVWYPLYRLREAGAEVVTLGTGKKTEYKSKLGYPVHADADVHAVQAADFDGLIIPGGFAPDFMRRYPGPAALTAAISAAKKPIAAICHGVWICASANILRGRTATCFFAIKDDIENAGARYVDTEVAVDGHLVTARKPDDLPAYVREFMKLL